MNENEEIKKSKHSRFVEMEEKLQKNVPAFIIYSIAIIILMCIACLAVFFYANKGYEQVMVPNITGKSLTRALLEMQEKELYPKIQLRYSDLPGEAGQVLSQTPSAGTIVKAGRRVTLVVSRGIMVDHVGNYIGTSLDVLKTTLDALYGGTDTPALFIGNPVFRIDDSPEGTILEQDPAEGTPISQPIELHLVVSSGPNKSTAKVPELQGKSISQILNIIANTNLLFDFKARLAQEEDTLGVVVSQEAEADTMLPEYSHVGVDIAMKDIEGSVNSQNETQGILSCEVEQYPFAVPFKLDAIPVDGASYTVATFNHIGGNVTVPYSVPRGATLVLSAINQEKERITVQ